MASMRHEPVYGIRTYGAAPLLPMHGHLNTLLTRPAPPLAAERFVGVEGIVNGMDIDEWNPKTDKYLTLPYDVGTVYAGKAAAKEALQVRGRAGGLAGCGVGCVV